VYILVVWVVGTSWSLSIEWSERGPIPISESVDYNSERTHGEMWGAKFSANLNFRIINVA